MSLSIKPTALSLAVEQRDRSASIQALEAGVGTGKGQRLSDINRLLGWILPDASTSATSKPEGSDEVFDALLRCLSPGDTESIRHVYRHLATRNHPHQLEAFLARKFDVKPDQPTKNAITIALSQGYWPCVDQVCPDLLWGEFHREMLFKHAANALMANDDECGFFKASHAKHMTSLPSPLSLVRKDFHDALNRAMKWDISWPSDAAQGLCVYEQAGWVDLGVLLELCKDPATRTVLTQAVALAQADTLEQATSASPRPTSSVRL